MTRDIAPDLLLLAALGLAALIFLRWRKGRWGTDLPAAPPGAPAGSGAIPLGQYAVRPGAQWLVLQPGQ